jgi:hypothetical protein
VRLPQANAEVTEFGPLSWGSAHTDRSRHYIVSLSFDFLGFTIALNFCVTKMRAD